MHAFFCVSSVPYLFPIMVTVSHRNPLEKEFRVLQIILEKKTKKALSVSNIKDAVVTNIIVLRFCFCTALLESF